MNDLIAVMNTFCFYKPFFGCTGDIVKYLFEQYGQGRSPTFGLLERYLQLGIIVNTLISALLDLSTAAKSAVGNTFYHNCIWLVYSAVCF